MKKKGSANTDTPTHIVGVGASAGGLMALEQFFQTVPAETGLAFVVIQHLPADHKSMMVDLLAKYTDLPVFYIEESMPAKADCIYLIPPGYNIKIFHGKFLLSRADHSRHLNLPIDVFLQSLAEDQEEKAIAIILSGTGSDGSRGVRYIKEKFGIVLVQDETTAQFDGMPRSAIATGVTDFVLPPDEMIHKILSYIQHPFARNTAPPKQIIADETGLTRIFSLLREHHLVDFTFYKQATVLRRIERRMSINQVHELRDYVKLLESYSKEINILYNELLIGVTSFFRDIDAFSFLRQKIIPNMLRKLKDKEIRFWVEGCSSGEEAYSLAILCLECMEEQRLSANVKIFATDVDKRAILFSSEGIYPESISADLTPKQMAKYFYRRENHYQVSRQLREMVVFAQHNILKDPPFTKIDLLSCRNLLIYLQPVLQKRALEKFNFALNPDGILFLGASESVGDMTYYFESLNHKWKIYRSKGKRVAIMGAQERYPQNRYVALKAHAGIPTQHRHYMHERIQERLLEAMAARYFSLSILVNEDNEILHVLGDTRTLLNYPSGKPAANLHKVIVKEMLVPVTAGLQKAFRENKPVKYSEIHFHHDGDLITGRMEIHRLPEKGDEIPLAAIFFEDIEKRAQEATDSLPEIDLHVEKRIENLENELQFTRESLQTTIEELETSNEELGATNEELMASNEELQSTNEELQSVNEELYTVNAEYQGKNIELVEMKNDLENLFVNLRMPILFLDENLEIRQFTPEIRQLFKIAGNDIGRPVDHVPTHMKEFDFSAFILQNKSLRSVAEIEIQVQNGSWYMMRTHPYKIAKDVFSGVVILFFDITRKKENEFKLRRLATVVMDSNDAIMVQDFDGDIRAWNRAAESMYGYTEAEALTMNIRDLLPRDHDPAAIDYMIQIQKGEEVKPFKTLRLTKNGRQINVYLTPTKLVDDAGTPIAVATTERDIKSMPEDFIC